MISTVQPILLKKYIKTVIEDVTFGVKKKECFGLLGPNSVGKLIILNIISSNFPQTTGNVHFNGIDSYKSKEIISYCPQENYIKYFKVDEHKNKPVKNLSGGVKHKLCILLTICASPNQIILDEPTAGIDPVIRLFVWDMIKEVKENNKSSIILTTYLIEEAQELCDCLV
ncbi:P-loop containing nucleoside triphosphate hydrolase protein [Piromyces finnis]|uniref:p-loop containing nucleoside triphosphate hydrolase protein n=1 Tax=Piromyces finnis TaxID=1754191 RepID=A0A1Y1VNB5_9FUNG|nr:P-loop containing nucleoside triphosphate hydrolase protein [Piromyces finnis]|eukprot:ORX60896.1 P-loop containing nucleoside triphosphate hydrolase protein [Piromyces finnis]